MEADEIILQTLPYRAPEVWFGGKETRFYLFVFNLSIIYKCILCSTDL